MLISIIVLLALTLLLVYWRAPVIAVHGLGLRSCEWNWLSLEWNWFTAKFLDHDPISGLTDGSYFWMRDRFWAAYDREHPDEPPLAY